jgi:hypothetical protein
VEQEEARELELGDQVELLRNRAFARRRLGEPQYCSRTPRGRPRAGRPASRSRRRVGIAIAQPWVRSNVGGGGDLGCAHRLPVAGKRSIPPRGRAGQTRGCHAAPARSRRAGAAADGDQASWRALRRSWWTWTSPVATVAPQIAGELAESGVPAGAASLVRALSSTAEAVECGRDARPRWDLDLQARAGRNRKADQSLIQLEQPRAKLGQAGRHPRGRVPACASVRSGRGWRSLDVSTRTVTVHRRE